MFFIHTANLEGLGHRHYLACGRHAAVAADPPRDIDLAELASSTREAVMRSLEITDVSRLMAMRTSGLFDASVQAANDPSAAGAVQQRRRSGRGAGQEGELSR